MKSPLLQPYDKSASRKRRILNLHQVFHPTREAMAADALDAAADHIAAVATLPSGHRRTGLGLIDNYRPYCFEKNNDRWPDGRWHLLDRNYDHWIDHCISFTRDELVVLGLERWECSRGVVAGCGKHGFMLADDCLWYSPTRWKLLHLAGAMQRLAEAVDQMTEKAEGAT